ncbi:sphingosine-1-phosphate lyase 1-like isoform X2 [Ostrea edulis]|uniref:sphingosine-1-phosphate lyase 1-like isoform X2 n=1 Tax=Ostrea edulis TaxID=37623 RepID=UPI0024AF6203|nr:sphingosine-1-phosphate lyase 1-like isoform X2 [Ostrea edulis]
MIQTTNVMSKLMETVAGPLVPYWDIVRDRVNSSCAGVEPWKIIVCSCGTTLLVLTARDILFSDEDTLTNRTKKEFFRLVKKIPFVKRKIAEEKKKILKDMEHTMNADVDGYITRLPENGLEVEALMEELKKYQSLAKVDWANGTISGTVYGGEPELTKLMEKVYGMFAWTNPLHADIFPDIRKMEAEVVRMCCTMFNGDSQSCGTMTAGGTESILMACLTYRNIARERGIKIPEIIVPVTAHAAFDKAAAYFHLRITHIPIDEKTRRVDINAMRRAINKNTCMLMGSVPQFPHGIIDDIQSISELGLKYNIPVHVDCCLGGFLYPFMEKAGYSVPVADFRVPGVTSISADTHKYAFAPKGSSVVLYRNDDYRRMQFFVQPDWPGGIYATASVGGSRPGAIIAVCWATLMYYGEKSYIESTRKIISTTRYIKAGLKKIPGFHVFGDPLMSVVGFGPAEGFKYNIFTFSDMIAKRGWNLNPLQFPSSIHLCVTLLHTKEGVADKFLQDARECLEELLNSADAEAGGMAAMYGTSQSIPDRSMVAELAGCFVSSLYTTNKSEESNGTVPTN